MASASYADLKQWFNAVCDLPDRAAQEQALHELGLSEAQLAEVLELLGHADSVTHFSGPVAAVAGELLGSELKVGDRLGAWTLVGTLGEGGMGRVLLAERADGHYQQLAAIKLLSGHASPEALQRLSRERQILAQLNHPNIARLLDGGTTPAGQPYLVMEFSDGEPIDRYCMKRDLGLPARLALVRTVAEALACAHRHLVVHCDIKPANILVDGEGRVLVLDFGISRLLGAEDGEPGHAAMTPGFSSPEQSMGQAPGTLSDVYSLGRLLRVLTEPVAGRRAAELDAVVKRATATVPELRYESVGALRAELNRLLDHRPLAALKDRRGHVVAKLLRRQWPWVLAGGAALGLSVAFTLSLVHQRDRALAAEQRAQEEADAARQTGAFLTSLFDAADVNNGGSAGMSAEALVDAGRKRLGEDRNLRPVLRAQLYQTLGGIYENLNRYEAAGEAYGQAAALYRELGDTFNEGVLLGRQSRVNGNFGRYVKGAELARRAVELFQPLARDPAKADALAIARFHLAYSLTNLGKSDEAAGLLQLARQQILQSQGETSEELPKILNVMAIVDDNQDKIANSIAHFREAARIQGKLRGEAHPTTLKYRDNLITQLSFGGDAKEALSLAQTLVADTLKVFGPTGLRYAGALVTEGRSLEALGRYVEAQVSLEKAGVIFRQHPGEDLAHLREIERSLNRVTRMLGDRRAALAHAQEIMAITLRLNPDDGFTQQRMRFDLVETLMVFGETAAARASLDLVLAQRRHLPEGDANRLQAEVQDAALNVEQGRLDEAGQQLKRLEAFLAPLGPGGEAMLHQARGRLLSRRGQYEQAASEFERELALCREQYKVVNHPGLAEPLLDLAQAHVALQQRDAARALLPELRRTLQQQVADSPWRRQFTALERQLASP